jgi:hypothetical protein
MNEDRGKFGGPSPPWGRYIGIIGLGDAEISDLLE